jgi:tetratricopeptide (TPR) repeat protein
LKIMSAAADAEDKTEKGTVTPGPLAPARELYGAMLLERGMAADALAAFEAVLKKEPNRFNALSGAARAAERLGNREKAAGYYKQVIELARDSGSDRPDLTIANRFLAKR